MTGISQALNRKRSLMRSMELEAEGLILSLLDQLRPTIHASLDYHALAQSKNRLEFIARHMCEYFFYDAFYIVDHINNTSKYPEPPNEHSALTLQIENHHHHWGFSGFEFLGMDKNGSIATLQFNSSCLQSQLINEFDDFPMIQIRFCISGINNNNNNLFNVYISPLNLIDLPHIEKILPIWQRWIAHSMRWVSGRSEAPVLRWAADD